MQITAGIESSQVLQRGPEDTASFSLQGEYNGSGPVTARVTGENVLLKSTGSGENGRWSVDVAGVPTGGPYRVEVECGKETCSVDEVFVGDIWVLAGQSNMEGVGNLQNVESPVPSVRSFDLADRWQIAEEPLHWLFESVDRAHWPCEPDQVQQLAEAHRAFRPKGAGLGLSFGVALAAAQHLPIGLVACARGGTSMQQWSPELKDHGGDSLYGSMLRRIKKLGGVRGILWYQGESDANPADVDAFHDRLRRLVESLRADTGIPDLPFLHVQLGRFVAEGTLADLRAWNSVQETHRRIADEIANTGATTAIDLELDDAIHIGTQGLRRLGRRLAVLARVIAYGETSLHPGPQVVRVTLEGESRDRITVRYANVNGALQSAGRISGFSIRNYDGHNLPLIYKAEIDPGDASSVILWLGAPVPKGAALHYGWGRDPYCNLVDSMDLAAPVFGPFPLH